MKPHSSLLHLLNDGSMTLQAAAASLNVDLRKLRALLFKENILVWNQVDGTTRRIHGGNFRITLLVSLAGYTKMFVVKGSYPFTSVIRIIEEGLELTRGCYQLSYKHCNPLVGNVLIKTDCDWHRAVNFSKWNGYVMPLDLKILGAGAEKIPVAAGAEKNRNPKNSLYPSIAAQNKLCFFTQSKEMNSTGKVPSTLRLTREHILLLNDGSLTLDQAAARFDVDLKRFKAILKKENILVWNHVDGTTRRIHGHNYTITMLVSLEKDNAARFFVKGWFPFEFVIRIIESEFKLTRGAYKLSYKHFNESVGDVLIETDRDWHEAVIFFKLNAYIMLLDLKKIPGAGAKKIPDAGAGTSGFVA